MGIFGDVVGKVGLKYEVDITQAKAGLRELTGEQKKNAQAAVQGLEDQKKAHEQTMKAITIGFGIAAGAIAIGAASWKSYAEQTRLSAATVGMDIGRLRAASHGLVTDMDLMRVAAESMNGRWKLSSEEMEKVLGAAVEVERRGLAPLSVAIDKLGEALKKGEVDPLKELGIVYDESVAKIDKRRAALDALGRASRSAAEGAESEAESLRRAATDAENYYNRAKQGAGQFAMETVAGFVIIGDAIGDMGSALKDWATYDLTFAEIAMQGFVARGWAEVDRNAAQIRKRIAEIDAATAEVNRRRAEDEGWVDYKSGKQVEAQRNAAQAQKDRFNARSAANKRSGGGGSSGDTGGYSDMLGRLGNRARLGLAIGEQRANEDAAIMEAARGLFDQLGSVGDALSSTGDDLLADSNVVGTKAPSFMEKLLGPVDEIHGYTDAWGTFTQAATAGYMALVSGSESAGAAMKKIIAQSIAAEGSRMLIMALREGAEAVAELAKGNFASAGTHALAAAKFGAGAAIAGVVANQLGGGGGASAGAGASASGIGLGGGSSQPAPINRFYVIGDSYGVESPRSQNLRFRASERAALAQGPSPVGTEYA
jgi:hypothetical protein